MLTSLFSSSIRADVLALLLNSPDEKFYMREIAKLLRKDPSGVKRELDKLEEMGVLFSEKVANLKYFRANVDSPLYSELKNLIAKSLGLPGALKSLLRVNGVTIAFIYGSYAEGEESPTVDLIVVGPSTPALWFGLKDIENKFGKKINCSVFDEADYKVKKKKDISLGRILSEKIITLLGKV
ncbi:MAG: winged helix-turn-helix transcriptional regulator [Nitrospirae bacterium]|nr:winged helix-turn-helix transcriptional regulator [Nitrospirota bacterium]